MAWNHPNSYVFFKKNKDFLSIVDLRFSTNSTKSSNNIGIVQNIWEPYVVYIRTYFDLLNFFLSRKLSKLLNVFYSEYGVAVH